LPAGSYFPTGTTTNVFMATDINGNSSTCSFTVTVNDDQAPTPDADSSAAFSFGSGPIAVLCPDATTTLDSILVSGAPLSLNSGDLSSVCINIPHTWVSDLTINLISPLGTIFTLTDGNGGSGDNYTNTCFDMSAATNITTGTPPFTGSFIPEGAGGFDSFNGEDPNGYWKISIFDAFFGDQGTLTNFDINFNFQYPTLLEEAHVECSIAAPTAVDNCDGALTATTSDPTSFTADGTYTVNWTYTDAAGNTATQSQTVIVDDVTAPVPDAASLPIVSNPCTATVSGVPTATDNCMGSITGTTTDALTYNVEGTYTVEWTYDDGRGNITTQTQTVIVTDNAPPVPNVAILPNVTGNCVVTIDSPPTATDGCSGTIIGTTTDPVSYNLIGTFFVIWTFDDGNGNTWTQNQTVVVSPCLGLEDEAGNWNAMVYPNPGSGIFTLTLSQIPTTNTEIRLVDALGQVLYAGMLTEQSKQFDFSHLASATYYLLINNNEGQISKPVIIRHND
jgi:subtilisin-like proprotein convertase family protein